jgi:hypothetical protein
MRPEPVLPPFLRLMPTGAVEFSRTGVTEWSGHDVNWGSNPTFAPPSYAEIIASAMAGELSAAHCPHGLVVTQRCLDLFQRFALTHCRVQEIGSA